MTLATFGEINYLAVLVAAVLYMGLGALWYGPLWGKPWMAALGFTDEDVQGGSPLIYLLPMIFYLLASVVVAFLVNALGLTSIGEGMFLAGLGYLGFLLPSMGSSYAFQGRSTQLFLIDSGYHLLGFLILGIVLTLWQ